MKFNTSYETAYPIKFLPVGDDICDTTGYLPPNVRINSMIAAGEKLIAFRDEQATILNEIYADERALPYNPSELEMLEIHKITSERAKKALQRMEESLRRVEKETADLAQQAGSEQPSEPKKEVPAEVPKEQPAK